MHLLTEGLIEMSMGIAEVKETSNVDEANALLADNWVLLEVFKRKEGESDCVVYVLGLPRMEKLRRELPDYDSLSL